MPIRTARRALTDSALAWLAAAAAAALLLLPVATALGAPWRALAAAVLALALPLHWLWLGSGARQLGRSVRGWVALALVFPVGGAAALLLLLGLPDEPVAQPSPVR